MKSTRNKKGKRIIAVSGGFDPLHAGHLNLLEEAKKLGDELVVILNNDHWLRKKKGKEFMSQEERKRILESLRAVDRVMITRHPPSPSDMSVSREIRELKPHVFANGGDRHERNVPEVPACAEAGCDMVFGVGGGKVQSSSWLLLAYQQPEKKTLRSNRKTKSSAKKKKNSRGR